MLEQAVRHLFEHQADVLVADLLGHDVERHGRETGVHRPHHPRQHGAVADPRIEDPQRRRRRLQIAEFERNPAGDFGLLAAGRDEQQIFLAVVEKPEAGRRRFSVPRRTPLVVLAGADGLPGAAGNVLPCSDK